MSDSISGHSNNGVAPQSRSWKHLHIDRRSRSYCQVTFDHPPINTITATTVAELAELVGLIEQDPDLNVVVFDSANPDFYLAHDDLEHDPGRTALGSVRPGRRRGSTSWFGCPVRRWSASPRSGDAPAAPAASSCWPVTCGSPPARTPCSARFEVGIGVVPGGGPMARLARLVGRGRALEILLVGRRSRRTAGGAVRVRQPADRRRPTRRRGRRHGGRTATLRSRHDRPHQVLCRPGDAARHLVGRHPRRLSSRRGHLRRGRGQRARQLTARPDPELGEDFPQVPLDGAGAEEEP